jgi:hypothetical protein
MLLWRGNSEYIQIARSGLGYPSTADLGDNVMEVLLALVFYFVIWVLVIWGSSYINQNVV